MNAQIGQTSRGLMGHKACLRRSVVLLGRTDKAAHARCYSISHLLPNELQEVQSSFLFFFRKGSDHATVHPWCMTWLIHMWDVCFLLLFRG